MLAISRLISGRDVRVLYTITFFGTKWIDKEM